MEVERLSLLIKPHHLLDIFKLYGRGVERFVPDEKHRHDFYVAGNRVIGNKVGEVRFTYGNDDICKPCVCLRQGVCGDRFVYGGAEYSKNQYNEELDRRLIDRLGLETDKGYKFSDVVPWIYGKLSLDLIEYVWRDREREENESRYEDTRRGMEKYLTGERARAVTMGLAN